MSFFSKTEVASELPLVANEEPELRIVLLGKVGVGKSASGNTILGGKNLFRSEPSLSAITTKCQKQMRNIGTQHVVVVDTPGLCNADKTDEEVVREIKKSISLAKPGPHVFLIVLRMTDKYTSEEQRVVEIIRSTFGKNTMAHAMVLFTYGDALKDISRDDFIRSNGNLHNLIEECNWRCHVFNKAVEDADQVADQDADQVPDQVADQVPDQVAKLLLKINERVQATERSIYTAEMLQEAEIASAKVRNAAGGGEVMLGSIQNSAYFGILVGCLMGYLVSGGEVTSTIGAVAGALAGGALGSVVAGLVILARKNTCCKTCCK